MVWSGCRRPLRTSESPCLACLVPSTTVLGSKPVKHEWEKMDHGKNKDYEYLQGNNKCVSYFLIVLSFSRLLCLDVFFVHRGYHVGWSLELSSRPIHTYAYIHITHVPTYSVASDGCSASPPVRPHHPPRAMAISLSPSLVHGGSPRAHDSPTRVGSCLSVCLSLLPLPLQEKPPVLFCRVLAWACPPPGLRIPIHSRVTSTAVLVPD